MSIQLKPNTYYKTRDGRKAFVGFRIPGAERLYPWIGYCEGDACVYTWVENGSYRLDSESPKDIIAEWSEPKLRPWKMDEVPLGACFRLKVRAVGEYMITGRCSYYMIVTVLGSINFDRAVSDGEHSIDNGKTWHPCGVME